MALPPLPASNTKRYFVGVLAGVLQHHIQVRTSDTVTDAQMVTKLSSDFGLLLPVMFNDAQFNTLDVAVKNSDVRNPVTGWSALIGQVAGGQPDNDEPLTLCARGRSSDGRKTRLFLWGMQFTRPNDWEFIPGGATVYATFLTRLASDNQVYLSISGLLPVWKPDYTVNYNDNAIKRKRP